MDSVTFDRTDLAIISQLREHISRFDDLPPAMQKRLVDNRKRTVPEPEGAVDRKFADLAKEAGLDISPQHREWGEDQTILRDRLYSEAQASVLASWPTVTPDQVAVGDPAELLQQAHQDYTDATVTDANDAQALHLADLLVQKAQSALALYDDLDDEIGESLASQLRSGVAEADLPTHLQMESRDKSRCLDRVEHANRVRQRLAAEARHSTAQRALALKRLRETAAMVLYASAAPLVGKLEAAMQTWLAAAEELLAMTFACPDCATPLPAGIREAIGRPPQAPERKPALIEAWRARHAALMGADATPPPVEGEHTGTEA
jgi:hypothetical protein